MKGKYDVKKLWKRNQIMITALALMLAIAGYLNFTGKEIGNEVMVTTSAQFEEADAGTVEEQARTENVEESPLLYDISDEDLDTSTADIESMDQDLAEGEYIDESAAETIGETTDAKETMSDTALAPTTAADETADASTVDTSEIPGEAVFTSTTGITNLASANLLKEQTRAKNKEALLEIINNTNISDSAKQDAINSMISLTEMSEKECSAEILLEAKGFNDVVVSISGETADVMIGIAELTDAERAQIEDIVKRKTGITAENIIISPVGE